MFFRVPKKSRKTPPAPERTGCAYFILERGFLPDPWWDWDDIIDLDYTQEGVRRYMTEALKYWVKETG